MIEFFSGRCRVLPMQGLFYLYVHYNIFNVNCQLSILLRFLYVLRRLIPLFPSKKAALYILSNQNYLYRHNAFHSASAYYSILLLLSSPTGSSPVSSSSTSSPQTQSQFPANCSPDH